MPTANTPNVAALLRTRARDEHGVRAPALGQFLAARCHLPGAAAAQLAAGAPVALNRTQVEHVARALALDPDLLAAVLLPNSPELLAHVINQAAAVSLDPHTCSTCSALDVQAQGADALDLPQLRALAFDLLSHLVLRSPQSSPSISENDAVELGEPEPLLEVVSELDRAAQIRLLAYAYRERNNARARTQPDALASYDRLRRAHLSPLVRSICDHLASRPGNTSIAAGDLVEALHLSGADVLPQLERSAENSYLALHAEGFSVEGPPLVFDRDGGELRVRLSPDARRRWLELLAHPRG